MPAKICQGVFFPVSQKRALQVAALWLWCLWQYALELGSWEMFAFAAAAAIPVLLYNGRRGPGLKWLFYGFYPAHLLFLWLVCVAMGIAGIPAI